MSTTAVMEVWAGTALVLLFVLFLMSAWYRRRHVGVPDGYGSFGRRDRVVRWVRFFVVLAGVAASGYVAWTVPSYGGVLIAPTLGALIVVVGVTAIDVLSFGFQSRRRPQRAWRALPGRLISLTVVAFGILGVGLTEAWQHSGPDGMSYIAVWTVDNVGHVQVVMPYPGPAYAVPLIEAIAVLVVVAIAATVVVLRRPMYLPTSDHAALDRGLRARTVRDIWLAVIAAVAGSAATVGADLAWAMVAVGPDIWIRAMKILLAAGAGAWMLATTLWAISNLLLTTHATEDWDVIAARDPVARPAVIPA